MQNILPKGFASSHLLSKNVLAQSDPNYVASKVADKPIALLRSPMVVDVRISPGSTLTKLSAEKTAAHTIGKV